MADLVLGAARSVVEGMLTKVQSAIETEAKLRQSAQSDLAFITEEFQMMQSFLEVVDEVRAENKVVRTWVGQVSELAYDVEDCMEFVTHMDINSDWWRRLFLPWKTLPLDAAVAELKQLKARVEDVSNKNIRYNLISESGFKAGTQQELVPSSAAVAATSLHTLTEAMTNENTKQDIGRLAQLITMGDSDDLRVIWVWETAGDLGFKSIVRQAYQSVDVCRTFPCRGWVKLTHPFNRHEVLRSFMAQFYTNSCLQNDPTVHTDVLARMEETATTQVGLIKEFMRQVNERRYLVVLENMSTMEEWDAVRTYLPDRKNGSLIIVSTQQSEVASLGVGDPYQVLEMEQYSACVLFKEGPEGKEGEVRYSSGRKSNKRIPTSKHDAACSWMEEFTLVGREAQTNELRAYLCQADNKDEGQSVMSVWGMPGVGKSALVRYLYCETMLQRRAMFDKYTWVDVSHPFNLNDFCQSLLSDLGSESSETRGVKDPIEMCRRFLKDDRCLVVIDDVQSNEEWDLIQPVLVSRDSRSVIIAITNESRIARRCAGSEGFIVNVTCLGPEAAIDLLKNEVRRKNSASPFKEAIHLSELLLEELIPKCGGIPKILVAAAGVLVDKTVTWVHSSTGDLIRQFSMQELESDPDLSSGVGGILRWLDSFIRTYPDSLKRCLLYLSIFQDQERSIRRRRLVRRWMAESYCKAIDYGSLEEIGEAYFSRLVDLSMIHQPSRSFSNEFKYRRMYRCQVNGFIGEYVFSRPKEENLVFQLEKSCSLTTRRTGRHLVLHESWDRDRVIFESIDFSRLRSLTVFGKWEPFFVSASMKVLRVLDLEDALCVTDKDVEQMVKLLPRLKFLSLRGCLDIHRLPSSLGDLRQLETLDVRQTSVIALPASITKLKKLQYFRAGTKMWTEERSTECSSSWLPGFCRRQRIIRRTPSNGVEVPTGIEKLTALHTLGVVNVSEARGEAIMKELKKLTQLRKLGVSGIKEKNIKEFCSSISCHSHLESLSVRFSKGHEVYVHMMGPGAKLESLKLFGLVNRLPHWIKNLWRLRKLDLEITISEEVELIKVLGEISRELCILRLRVKPLQGADTNLDFRVSEKRSFPKLKVLRVACFSSKLQVIFGSESMQNLEVLTAVSYLELSELKHLCKLNEVRLVLPHDAKLKRDIVT